MSQIQQLFAGGTNLTAALYFSVLSYDGSHSLTLEDDSAFALTSTISYRLVAESKTIKRTEQPVIEYEIE